MNKLKYILLVIILILAMLSIFGCEKYHESDEINGLINTNDLAIHMEVGDNDNGYTVEKIGDSNSEYYLKIVAKDTYSLRGEAGIKPGNVYELSITLKNIDADPTINYSFWEKPKTSLRHYTFKGVNGNPPTAETQEVYDDWITFKETFETREGEDSFILTLHSGEGTFFIKEINIKKTH
jgi:hypothetical protein